MTIRTKRCIVTLPNGERCRERIRTGNKCALHRDAGPLPVRRCECDRPRPATDEDGDMTCTKCGRALAANTTPRPTAAGERGNP